jgi:hypothetical protein
MSIKFECPHCQKKLNVPDEMAGKKGRCTGCKSPLVVPGTPAPASVDAPRPALPRTPMPTKGGNGESHPRIPPVIGPGKKAPSAATPSPEDIEALAAAAFIDKPAEPEATTEETIKFECEYCGFALEVSSDLGGKRTQCSDCRRITRVPEVVKRAAREWHRAAQTAAQAQATEAAKEGAWGTANINQVDQNALVEAGILPDDTPPLTRTQLIVRWSVRGVAAVAVLGILVYGVNRVMTWSGDRKEESLRRKAILVASEDRVSPEGMAVLRIALGDHYRRERRLREGNDPGSAKEASEQFDLAYHYLANGKRPDRDLALTRLALAAVELGGSGDDVANGVCEKWDEVQRKLNKYLSSIYDPEARVLALRHVCRRLIAHNQADRARFLAFQLNDPVGNNPEDRVIKAEILAQAGLEFLPGNRPLAEEIAKRLAAFGAKADEPPPLRPAVVALLTVVGSKKTPGAFVAPDPREQMTPEERAQAEIDNARAATDRASQEIGLVEALARQGKLEEARRRTRGLSGEVKLRALVSLAEAAADANPADRSDLEAACAFAANPEFPYDWPRVRLVERAAHAGVSEDLLKPVAARIQAPELRGRAQFAIFHSKLTHSRGSFDEALADYVEPRTLGQQLAFLELAQANTNAANHYTDKVAAWDKDKGLRAFGTIGALVGLRWKVEPDEP